VRTAILGLEDWSGDTKTLHGNLEGLSRLSVGEHRMVFRHHEGRIEVLSEAPRSVVYEFLAAHLHDLLE